MQSVSRLVARLRPLAVFATLATTAAVRAEPSAEGLVLHYAFDGDDGTNAWDSSGAGHHGTWRGAVPVASPRGLAARLDGSAWIDGGRHALGASDVTLAIWLRTTQLTEATLFGGWGSVGTPGVRFLINAGGRMGLASLYAAAGNRWIHGTSIVTDERWHHVVFQDAGGTLRLFVDGVLDAEAVAGTTVYDNWDWTVGRAEAAAGFFAGDVDDVRLYRRALTAAEVRELYEALRPPSFAFAVAGEPAPVGAPSPFGYGMHTLQEGERIVTAADSPVPAGAGRRHICSGWRGTGSVPAAGTSNLVSFAATADSTLTWLWQAEVYLDTSAGAGGSVDVTDGWQAEGGATVVRALPLEGYNLAQWQGDVPDGQSQANPLLLPMDRPRTVTATFRLLTLDDGLALRYLFDEAGGGTVSDRSPWHNDGQLQGAVRAVDAQLGPVCAFDGAGAAVATADAPSLRFGAESFAWTAWVRLDRPDTPGRQTILAKRTPDGSGGGWDLAWDPALRRWQARVGDGLRAAAVVSDGPAAAGTRTHLAIVADRAAGRLRLYVNGMLQSAQADLAGLGAPDSAAALFAGRAASGAEPLAGAVGDLCLYRRALSPDEVRQILNRTADPGLVLRYTFDEYAGGTILDHSGRGNHGTPSGGPQRDEHGVAGAACRFDGVDDWVGCGGNASLQLRDSLTYALWVRRTAPGAKTGSLLSRRSGQDATTIAASLGLESDGAASAVIAAGNLYRETPTGVASRPTLIADDQWHHVALVYAAGVSLTVYVDGRATGQRITGIAPALNSRTLPVTLAWRDTYLTRFAGSMDDVRIYDRVLDAAYITRLYETGKPAVQRRVVVAAEPVERGAPAPLGYGTHLVAGDAWVTNGVASPFDGGAGIRHVCTGWRGTGAAPPSGTGTQVVFAATADATVTWLWRTDYRLAIAAGEGGSAAPEGGWLNAGAAVLAQATSLTGYRFARWAGDVPVGRAGENPLALALDQPRTLQAEFERIVPWPAGGIELDDRRPLFAWTPTAGATWYLVWINRNGAAHLRRWLNQAHGTWQPDADLPGGQYAWWVQPWSAAAGYGTWSPAALFAIASRVPGAAAPLAPSVAADANPPRFAWTSAAHASWCYVWLNRDGATQARWWVPGAAETTPAAPLPFGRYDWWVQTWSPDGYGPWSGRASFALGIAAPADAAASRLAWDDAGSAGATWYRVRLVRNGAAYRDTWIRREETWLDGVHRAAALSPALPAGTYAWWIQCWSAGGGYGPWSGAFTFSVSP